MTTRSVNRFLLLGATAFSSLLISKAAFAFPGNYIACAIAAGGNPIRVLQLCGTPNDYNRGGWDRGGGWGRGDGGWDRGGGWGRGPGPDRGGHDGGWGRGPGPGRGGHDGGWGRSPGPGRPGPGRPGPGGHGGGRGGHR